MDNILNSIKEIVGERNVKVNEPMKLHTTFKIGGPADYYVKPTDVIQLKRLTELFNNHSIPYYVIGNGSNLLVSDDGYRGAIIRIYDKFTGYEVLPDSDDERTLVSVRAGMSLVKLGRELSELGLTGFEFASGIPGSIGGAVVMNAGAYGGEIKDVLVSAKVMDKDGNISELSKEELKLGYRTSIMDEKELIVVEVTLALKHGDKEQIRKTMVELSRRRIDKQPLEYPSAGSTFKRPEGYFAGKLIEDAGLKGLAVGGARVSDKHAGFVVNTGKATAADVIELTDKVAEAVYEQFNVKLNLEVRKVGFTS